MKVYKITFNAIFPYVMINTYIAFKNILAATLGRMTMLQHLRLCMLVNHSKCKLMQFN